MARRPTEQTPLLDKPHNIVDVDADVEPGALPTCKTAAPTQMGAPGGGSGGKGAVAGVGNGNGKRTKMTPIPWRQLLTLCLVRLVDPICFSQVFPYINDMLLGMGVVGPNEPERVGFYSGLIESTFSVAVAVAIYPWARLSGTYTFPRLSLSAGCSVGCRPRPGLPKYPSAWCLCSSSSLSSMFQTRSDENRCCCGASLE